MVETTYSLTENEFCEAVLHVDRIRRAAHYIFMRWIYLVLFCLWAAAFIGSLGYLFYLHAQRVTLPGSPVEYAVGLALDLSILWTLYSAAFRKQDARRYARKQFEKNFRKHSGVRIRVDRSGWREEGPVTGTMLVEWNMFDGWSESENMFLALKKERRFHMVPKRVLTPAQLSELRTLTGRRM